MNGNFHAHRPVILLVPLALLFMACSPPGSQTVVIPAAGGEVELSATVTLVVPPGAVAEDTSVLFVPLGADDLIELYPHRGLSESGVLSCFNFPENHIQFSLPVTVRITDIVDVPDALPIVHNFDTVSGGYGPYNASYVYTPSLGILEIELEHFTGVSVEVRERARQIVGPDDPCRNGTIRVEQSDEDFICESGACEITSSTLTVTFEDCTSTGTALTESAVFREVGPDCAPSIAVSALPTRIEPGASATVSATVKLGCKPLEGQTVSFDVTGLGTLSSNSEQTDEDGKCTVMFTAGDDSGTATVVASSAVSWYTDEILVSGSAGNEVSYGPERSETVEGSAEITIGPTDPWTGTLSMTYAPVTYFHDIYLSQSTYFPSAYSWAGGTVDVTFEFDPSVVELKADGNHWVEGTGTGQITGCGFTRAQPSFSYDDGDGTTASLTLTDFTYDVISGTFPAIVAFRSADAVNFELLISTTLDYFNGWSIEADEYLLVTPPGPPDGIVVEDTEYAISYNDIFWIGDGANAFPIAEGTITGNFTNTTEPFASLEPPQYIYFIEPMAEPTHSFTLTLTPPE